MAKPKPRTATLKSKPATSQVRGTSYRGRSSSEQTVSMPPKTLIIYWFVYRKRLEKSDLNLLFGVWSQLGLVSIRSGRIPLPLILFCDLQIAHI
uniref:Uncharacterized protein n=1 Tax=Pyxicephalus adspersus TaxID=30357 RepID=A0AAV3A9B0_PYXAD|nr:TPA: hypothetical protein GDO54_014634 [Pyxicephalus adspersus]